MNVYTYGYERRVTVIIARNQQEAYTALEMITGLAPLAKLVSVVPTLGGYVVTHNILPF